MVTEKSAELDVSRRSFLRKSSQILLGLSVVSVPTIGCAKVLGKRTLSLYHTHTQQELNVTYALGKMYNPKALKQISQFLRDYKTGQVHSFDPRLFDILWSVQRQMGRKGHYEVICGYRSPKTNQMLRSGCSGVAEHSLHMKGQAIDIRLPGIRTRQIQQCAMAMRTGGVGYYPQSDFVHLDTGQFRTWGS